MLSQCYIRSSGIPISQGGENVNFELTGYYIDTHHYIHFIFPGGRDGQKQNSNSEAKSSASLSPTL